MDFDYLISSLNPEPVVQKKKKYENFTVTPIHDIVAWRKAQSVKEDAYRMRLKARDVRIAEVEASMGEKLASPTIHTTSWAEKLAFVQSEKERLLKLEDVAARTWEEPEVVRVPMHKRFGRWIVSLWKSANF